MSQILKRAVGDSSMSFNLHLYDKLCEERRQTLQKEVAQQHILAGLPGRQSIGRRAVGKLGSTLVAIGSKLEQFDHTAEPVVPGILNRK